MGYTTLWQEMLPGDGEIINPVVKKQYDIVEGKWPEAYNEVVLVLDSNNEITDMALYALGLISEEEIDIIVDAAINKAPLTVNTNRWTYAEIFDMEFRTIFPADCYTLDERTGLYTDMRDSNAGLKYLYDKGTPIKVVGIIRPNEDAVSGMLTGSIAYTSELTEYVIEKSKTSAAIKAQLDDTTNDIFTGLPFSENSENLTNKEKRTEFKKYLNSLDQKKKAETYVKIKSVPAVEEVEKFVSDTLKGMKREDIEEKLTPALSMQTGMSEKDIADYLSAMKDEDLEEIFATALEEQYKESIQKQMAELEKVAGMTAEEAESVIVEAFLN